jgi:orotidine-5'-phosphate decarboxylase
VNPIIVALDGLTIPKALDLARRLEGKVAAFKINDLFARGGPGIAGSIGCFGDVMLDLKLYDIPNTVSNICQAVKAWENGTGEKVKILTVHAHGGQEMMREACIQLPGRIAAVTVLTSFKDDGHYKNLTGTQRTIPEQVKELAQFAYCSGCSYVVCSAHELSVLKDVKIKKIVPGIRPAWHQKADDQKRVMTPKQAMDAGADFLVIGRPIVEAADPVGAAEQTLKELGV